MDIMALDVEGRTVTECPWKNGRLPSTMEFDIQGAQQAMPTKKNVDDDELAS